MPEVSPLGVPHWIQPRRVDMKQHVRRETLPAPGSPEQLNERLAELHRERLDRSRPLFEIHLIDGLASGRFAVYIKSHHVTWDGRSAAARIFGSLSTEPGPLLAGFHALPAAASPVAPELAQRPAVRIDARARVQGTLRAGHEPPRGAPGRRRAGPGATRHSPDRTRA